MNTKYRLLQLLLFICIATPFIVAQTPTTLVGAIPGQFAVSPSGGATYTIPIECPSGINGMQPNISLVYNSHTYDAATGNITSRSDLNNYTMSYGANGRPHALTSIAAVPTGTNTFPYPLTVTYTDFKKVATISQGDGQNAGSADYQITYGVDDQRRMSVFYPYGISNLPKLTRYYVGNYEEEWNSSSSKKIHYLSGAVFIKETGKSDQFYYSYADYQGSLIALQNVATGVLEKYAYDPWGARRNPTNWTLKDTRTTFIVNRGYTGHEHIDVLGIINMNGRVYDPLTAQFYSPDPQLQSPGNWLNYNRYGYCYGNPFKYTDPSGEFLWIIPAVAAIIGAYSGYSVGHAAGATGWNMAGYIAGGALIGAASGGAAAGLSALGVGAVVSGAVGGSLAGAGFSGLSSNWNGDKMIQGAVNGGVAGAAGAVVGASIGGGLGAFAGGSTANLTAQFLNNSDFRSWDWGSVLMSGVLSYGAYELTSYISWKSEGCKMGNYELSYNQFKTMQADYQRSRFWRVEYAGILTNNNGVVRAPSEYREQYEVNFDKNWTNEVLNNGGTRTHYHTHWDANGRVFTNSDGQTVRTADGPSKADFDFAKSTKFPGLLIDRKSTYFYGNTTTNYPSMNLTVSHNYSLNLGSVFLRFVPLFNMP